MKHNRLYKLYLTDCIHKDVFVGSWIIQECAEDEARHYLKLYAHSMRVEIIDTEAMEIVCEYELTREDIK